MKVRRPSPILLSLAVLVVGVAIWGSLTPGFTTSGNVRAILQNAALTGIVAVTMTPMTMAGQFVSLGTQASAVLGSMAFVYLVGNGVNVALAIVVVLAGLGVVGAIQGIIVALGLNPVITTLAVGAIIVGVLDRLSAGSAVTVKGDYLSWGTATVGTIPMAAFVFIIITIILTVVMGRTVFGRKTVLAGSNRLTALLSGISMNWMTIAVFVLASIGMAIAGILYGAQFGIVGTREFETITFSAVSAILVGGTAIGGGFGSPLRSGIGALIISMIESSLTLRGYELGVRLTVEGFLVLIVVVLMHLARRKAR
jgi:ribose transport system permease protein